MKVTEKSEFEIKPLTSYVFIKGMENPHIIRQTESGLYLPNGLSATESEGSGSRLEQMEEIIRYGEIVEVGADVKTLVVGDGVYFDIRSIRPIPFGKLGVMHLNEQNILAYVRKGE